MVSPRPDSEIIAMVQHGGGRAFTAMGDILYNHRDYPGDVADVFELLPAAEPISFCYSLPDLAYAYLFHRGFLKEAELADRWQVRELLGRYQDIGGEHGI